MSSEVSIVACMFNSGKRMILRSSKIKVLKLLFFFSLLFSKYSGTVILQTSKGNENWFEISLTDSSRNQE